MLSSWKKSIVYFIAVENKTYLLSERPAQGCKKLRSLRSGILDSWCVVRQMRLGPGETTLLVRIIGQDKGLAFLSIFVFV